MRDDLLTAIAHEFRTPLAGMLAIAEIVRDTPELETNERQRYLDLVCNDAHRLQSRIEALLDMLEYPDAAPRCTHI